MHPQNGDLKVELRSFVCCGLLLAAACCGTAFAGPVPAAVSPQVDTLVFRRDTISISRGLLFPGADTVAITVGLDSLAEPAISTQDVLRPLAGGPGRVVKASPILSVSDFVAMGDSLRLAYDFAGAMERYRQAAALPSGALHAEMLEKRMSLAQNGLNLSESCAAPKVVARQRFARKDFFRFYPLPPSSWRAAPNALDGAADREAGATYVPRNARTVFFSAADSEGYRHLYATEDRDTAWTLPVMLDENLLSGGNEIYPMLSPDGNRLYFASDDLYGIGGYDLYCSVRDPETGGWGQPTNLGFPFSSPADDFLLMDTADGKYTLFASNRACSADSVYIYVLEQQKVPFRSPAGSIDNLRKLAELVPAAAATHIDAGSAVSAAIPDNDNTRLYQERTAAVSRLRDTVSVLERTLGILREQLASSASSGVANADALAGMATAIARQEELLSQKRASLERAIQDVSSAEKTFLREGVRSRTRRAAEREVVGAGAAYTFTKQPLGPTLRLRFVGSGKAGGLWPGGAGASGASGASGATGASGADGGDAAGQTSASGDSFRIMPVGRFAQTNILPSGLVYQISLFTSPSHATLEDIRGLSPVYERMTTTLRYTYAAGLFSSYAAALSNLPAVRRLGFPDATIIAFRDGLPIPVSLARQSETAGR